MCVNRCMCVVLSHTNQGLPALFCRLMKSVAAATNSSSQVSMRFLVSGPVSSIFCLPTLPQRGMLGRIVLVGRPGMDDAARAEVLRGSSGSPSPSDSRPSPALPRR